MDLLLSYIIIFLLLAVAEVGYLRVAVRLGIADCPNGRSSHSRPTVRGGGAVFYLGAMAWAVWSGFEAPMFAAGLTLVAAVSFADDLRGLPVWLRLAVQTVAVAMTVRGLLPDPNLPVTAVAVLVGVAFLNAYNFMDGINGSAGLYALVTLGTLAVLDRSLGFADPRLIWCSVMAAVIFCYFNVRTNARCFAGDVGSLSIGFILLYLIAKLIMATGSAAWIVIVSVYGTDAFLTLAVRLGRRQNVFRAHRMHAYQLLCNELGHSHLRVASAYAGLQTVINTGAVLLDGGGYIYLGAVVAALAAAYVYIYQKATSASRG